MYDCIEDEVDVKRMERRRRVDYFKVNPNGTIGEWLEEEVKNRKR